MSDTTIFINDGGEGELPVVFVHSMAGNSNQWAAQLDYLRSTRRAIAIDLRGHGRSPRPADGDFGVEALANDIEAAVDALGLERFVLVGHSLGGSAAGAYAGRHPEQVAGLLLVDPSGDATKLPQADMTGFVGAMMSDAYQPVIEGYWGQILAGSDEAVEEQVLQDLRQTAKETVIGAFQGLLAYDPLPALARYDGPKLTVITPHNDTPFSLHHLCELPVKRIEGTGHWLQMDKPAEFNQIMADFLWSVSIDAEG